MVLEKVSCQERVSVMDIHAKKDALKGKDGGIKGSFGGNLSFADRDTVEDRLSICRNCDELKIGICTRCGCLIAAKVRLQIAVCPARKW